MANYSTNDLLVPVLRAMRNHSKFPNALTSAEIADQTVADLGTTLDCMGEKDGRPRFLSPFGNAVYQLKLRGVITPLKKGTYTLSPAGADFLDGKLTTLPPVVYVPPDKSKAGVPATPKAPKTPKAAKPAPEVSEDAEPEPVAPVAPPVPAESVEEIAERLAAAEEAPPAAKPAKRVKTAKLSVVPADDAPAWVRDNYLRGLVAANTPCFGQYSPKAEACGGCSLTPWCRNAQAAALSVLASKLVEAEAAKVSAATVKLHAETATALSPNAPRASVANPPRKIPVSYDGVCARTGAPLKAGSTGYYVAGEGVCSEEALSSEERASLVEGWGKP